MTSTGRGWTCPPPPTPMAPPGLLPPEDSRLGARHFLSSRNRQTLWCPLGVCSGLFQTGVGSEAWVCWGLGPCSA